MKKIILIGRTGSGKTTLAQTINEGLKKYKKTQAIQWNNHILDTPGEYIENRRFYHALITTSCDCDIIGLVQDCTDHEGIFPPSFAAMFNKPVIGIITKIDCQDKDMDYAQRCLLDAGVREILKVSATHGTGIGDIKRFLF